VSREILGLALDFDHFRALDDKIVDKARQFPGPTGASATSTGVIVIIDGVDVARCGSS
jgi:hypothetical protein